MSVILSANELVPEEIFESIWPNLICPGCRKNARWKDVSSYKNWRDKKILIHTCKSRFLGHTDTHILPENFWDVTPKVKSVHLCSVDGCDFVQIPNTDVWAYGKSKLKIYHLRGYVPKGVKFDLQKCPKHEGKFLRYVHLTRKDSYYIVVPTSLTRSLNDNIFLKALPTAGIYNGNCSYQSIYCASMNASRINEAISRLVKEGRNRACTT